MSISVLVAVQKSITLSEGAKQGFALSELKNGTIELTLKNKNAFFGFKIENYDTSFKILFKENRIVI